MMGKRARHGDKKSVLATFRKKFLPAHPSAELCFALYRLVLPEARLERGRKAKKAFLFSASHAPPHQLDKERQVYKVKEAALADVIGEALGVLKARARSGRAPLLAHARRRTATTTTSSWTGSGRGRATSRRTSSRRVVSLFRALPFPALYRRQVMEKMVGNSRDSVVSPTVQEVRIK